jgi:iron complex outermembrane receptor protein
MAAVFDTFHITGRMKSMGRRGSILLCCTSTLLAWICCTDSLLAQQRPARPSVADLKKLSVEELMGIRVTSVSKRPEPLGGAPAAIAVVTSEDIRRSGSTSVPEALRFVPGIHVARQTSNTWAVSSRGFSSVNSEKLLVLTDTRNLYTPLFSGVFWDVQDYLLQDIERIEVIRGPGATLWGSNAVNGVINIVTKNARDTQGAYVETSAGSEERVAAGARYGGRAGERTYYRVWGRYFDRDETSMSSQVSRDDWQLGHAGFRTDWERTSQEMLTVQGEMYHGDIGRLSPSITVIGREPPVPPFRVDVGGGNVLGRWRRITSERSGVQLRAYYDRTHRDDPSFVDTLHTFDVEFQQRLPLGRRQDVTWGLNYRLMANRNERGNILTLDPTYSRDQLFSGFVQDAIRLRSTVRLTLGTKLEHNDFSGFEVQPSARIAWDPASGHTLWGAVSRAVRVPTRLERDIAVDVSDPRANPVIRLLGNPAFESERLVATELGYRWQMSPSLATDLAAFHNRYRGLASLELGDPFSEPGSTRTILPVLNENLTAGRALGVEALVTYSPMARVRVTTNYSYVDLTLDPAGADLNRGAWLAGATPRHQFGVRSSMDLPAHFQFDAQFRALSRIRQLPSIISGEGISGYEELDARLAWDGWRQLEFSLVGQNLLNSRHIEFGAPGARGAIERSIYGKIAWGF